MTDAVSEPLRTRRVVVLYKDSDVFHHPTCKHVNEWQGGPRPHSAELPNLPELWRCLTVLHATLRPKAWRPRAGCQKIVESGAS